MSRPSDGRLPRALRAVALATAWGVIAVGCGSKNSDATRTASGGAAGAALADTTRFSVELNYSF